MKKSILGLLGIGMFFSMGILTSCEDEFTEDDALQRQEELLDKQNQQEQDLLDKELENAVALENLTQEQRMAYLAMQDSLERVGGIIVYAVRVMAGGNVNATNARTNAQAVAEGAEVTVVQNGVAIAQTADANGLVVFDDMRIGQVNVTVSAADHTTAFFTADITPAEGDAKSIRNASTTVPLFPVTAEAGAGRLVGKVEAETNLINDASEIAAGAQVTASIDLSDNTFQDNFLLNDGAGRITSISYQNATVTGTVGDDGSYELVVPAGIGNGNEGLPLEVTFGNFSAQQVLIQNNERDTVDVQFIPGATASTIPADPGVFVSIPTPSEPGSGVDISVTPIATSLFAGTNFDVEVLSGGAGYRGGADGTVRLAIAGADSTFAIFNVEDGRITDFDGVAKTDGIADVDEVFTAAPELGALVDFDATTEDTQAPTTAAQFRVKFQNNYDLELANGGENFTFIPSVRVKYSYYNSMNISSGGGNQADFSIITEYDVVDLETINGLSLVDGTHFLVNDARLPDASGLSGRTYMTSFEIVEVIPQARQMADLVPSINSAGELTAISVIDGGSGYTPGQRIDLTLATPNGMGSGAVAYIAEGDVDANGEIQAVTLTSGGSGYNTTANLAGQDNADSKSRSINVTTGESIRVNFDYGTGIRE